MFFMVLAIANFAFGSLNMGFYDIPLNFMMGILNYLACALSLLLWAMTRDVTGRHSPDRSI